MNQADIVTAVKRKYRITGATLDSDIAEAVVFAVDSLAPYIKRVSVDTSLTANRTTESVTVPVAGADVRKIYTKGSSGYWQQFSDYTKDGDLILFTSWLEDSTQIRLHLRTPFTIATIAQIPLSYKQAVIRLACSEFATMLAGDKSRYNIYAQSNGARAVDNMLDLADYYETKAEKVLLSLGVSEALD